MAAKEHYDKHLGSFYSWMVGDFESKQNEFSEFLNEMKILPRSSKNVIDLGAGHGIQTISLAKLGFHVTAIDFNEQLLQELKKNSEGFDIKIVNDDIKNISKYSNLNPELVVCYGDTISHLASLAEINKIITDIFLVLDRGGKILLSFRDYSKELIRDDRFIHVKSDDSRILTCVLDYTIDKVLVTDLLFEKIDNTWIQKVSSYEKVRISSNSIVELLEAAGFKIERNLVWNRLIHILAAKPLDSKID